MSRRLKIILGLIGLAVISFIAIQFFPLGNFRPSYKFPGNPAVDQQFQWDSPQTEQLARAACYDCHSNETQYPWYAYVAPASWLVYRDTNNGRATLNFSTMPKNKIEAHHLIGHIQNGTMPKRFYLPLHPEAQLTDEQKEQLIAGIMATFSH